MDYEKAKKDVWGLANAIAATGGDNNNLLRTTIEMQHAAATGKVQGQVLRDFMNNGLPIFPLLQKSLPELKGMSNAKAKEKLENEGISYDKLAYALDAASKSGGMFAGAMEKLSGTIGGKWSTILDYWQMGGAKLILSQNAAITKLEDMAIRGLQKFPEWIESITPTVSRLFDKFNELLPTLEKFGGGIMSVLKPIGEFAISDEVTKFIKSLGDLTGAIGKAAGWVLDHGVKQTAQVVTGGVAGFMQGLIGSWNYLVDRDQYDKDYDPSLKTDKKTLYNWGTLPVGAKGGVDSIAMKHVTDSLGQQNIFPDKKSANDWIDIVGKNKFWKTAFDLQTLALPEQTTSKKEDKSKGNSAMAEASDAVVSGGRKQTILQFNAPLIHIGEQKFNETKDMMKDVTERFAESLVLILAGVPG